MSKWISVKDKMPIDIMDGGSKVLVRYKVDNSGIMNIGVDGTMFGLWVLFGDDVTHWMPLPDTHETEDRK